MDKELKELLKVQLSSEYCKKNEPELVALIEDCLEKDCISPDLLPMMQRSVEGVKKEINQLSALMDSVR